MSMAFESVISDIEAVSIYPQLAKFLVRLSENPLAL